MPFDAEDLKKAKAEINSTMGQTTILGTREMAHMFPEKLQDLLARLEAAEAYLVALEFCLKHECIPWPCVAATDAKIAWRKAAGR